MRYTVHDRAGPVWPIYHDDVIKRKHFPHYWPFVRGIYRSPVNSPHIGQWRGAFFFWSPPLINGWVNNREAGDFRRNRAHYDAIVMHVWSTSLYATHVMPSLIHRYLAHLLIKKSISHRTSSSPRRKYYTSFFSLNATFQISIYGTSI